MTLVSTDVMNHKIQERSELAYGTERPFQLTFLHTCDYTLSIVDATYATFAFISVDEVASKIVVDSTTINPDYPVAGALTKPSTTKVFILRGEVTSLIVKDIYFNVEFTLNCHETVVTLVETEQIVSKEIIQSPNIPAEIVLEKVTLDLAENANCDMLLSGYFVV